MKAIAILGAGVLALSTSMANSQAIEGDPDFRAPTLRALSFETTEYFANYGLGHINASSAYAKGFTGAGSIIVFIDDGFQIDHPDLAPNILEHGTFSALYHGTMVSGLAAATKNDVGMHGVAFDSRLALYRISDDIFAFNRAGEIGAAAISNSYGWDIDVNNILNDPAFSTNPYQALGNQSPDSTAYWEELADSMRRAQEHGVIVWAAANVALADIDISAGLPLVLPDLQPSWIAVVNVNQDNVLQSVHCGSAATFCLAAPGFGTFSTVPTSTYGAGGGTSAATPHVAGAVAIARQMFPNAGSDQLAAMILQTATDIGVPGVDSIFGWGLLNLGNVAATLDKETAASFASASWSRFATMDQITSALHKRMGLAPISGPGPVVVHSYATPDMGFTNAGVSPDTGFWMVPLYSHSTLAAGAVSPGGTSEAVGILIGADLVDTGMLKAGIGGGYTRTDMRSRSGADRSSADGLHLTAYAEWTSNNWFARVAGHVAHFSQSQLRQEIAGAVGTSSIPVGNSLSDSKAGEVSARIGTTWNWGEQTLEPYIAATARAQSTGAFAESGAGIFSLHVPGDSLSQAEVGPGAKWISAPVSLGYLSATASLDVAYARLSGTNTYSTDAILLGTPIAGQTATVGRDIFRIGAQLNFEGPGKHLTGVIGYDSRLQRHHRSHSLSAGLKMRL